MNRLVNYYMLRPKFQFFNFSDNGLQSTHGLTDLKIFMNRLSVLTGLVEDSNEEPSFEMKDGLP